MTDIHAKTADLPPCPLCGAEPLVQRFPAHKHALPGLPDHPGSAVIECVPCGLTVSKPTLDEAVSTWSRRHPVTSADSGVQAAAQADPVAWLCEDLILPEDAPRITRVRSRAEGWAALMHEGKPVWRVTPLYAAPPAPTAPASTDDLAVAKRIAWAIVEDAGARYKNPDEMWDRIAGLSLAEQYMRAARAARGEG